MTGNAAPTPAEDASADKNTRTDARPDSEARQEIDARPEEAAEVLATGPRAGNRAGALAFLALVVVVGAAVHFYMADNGGEYLQQLDADLLRHAELSLRPTGTGQGASGIADAGLAVAPSWPLALYEKIRGDIALYAAAAAAAAFLWQLSARSRARRDAFLLHDKLNTELAALRERVAALEKREGKSS